MYKQLILFVFLVLSGAILKAQSPENITVFGKIGQPGTAKQLCNDAGTITLGSFSAQSNDIDLDTMYLCFNDMVSIVHNGDYDLSGDPQPLTEPGIGYAFYDCAPSVIGPDLATILTDPCLYKNTPFVDGNGDPIVEIGPDSIWVASEGQYGDITFNNDGGLQTGFNNGSPIQLWFAPITLDDFSSQGFEQAGATGSAGPCVDVNIEAAFSVVYLNAIVYNDINADAGANGCRGSFVLEGGLPEYNTSSAYSISISLNSDPSVVGIVTSGSVSHGETVIFEVPIPGIYDILIEDGKSCGASFSMDMSGCSAVDFFGPFTNATPGSVFCVDITVGNFTDVLSMQFSLAWDSSVLQFESLQNFNPNVTNLSSNNFGTNNASNGQLTFAWFDLTLTGVTLSDGDPIFSICFNAIGELDEHTPLQFTNSPTAVEIFDSNSEELGFGGHDGSIFISNDILFVELIQDSVSCTGLSDGSLNTTISGGVSPYSFLWSPLPVTGPQNGPEIINNAGGMITVSNLSAGLYEISTTDSDTPPNVSIDTVEVLEGLLLGAELDPIIRPSCFGQSDGTVTANPVVGGVLITNPDESFTFDWNTSATSQTLNAIPGGFYSLTITDTNSGCTAEASTTISEPPQIILSSNIIDASCTGSGDGGVNVAVSGGTPLAGGYSFEWDIPLILPESFNSNVNGLNPGTYNLTVTDASDCVMMNTFDVGADKVLVLDSIITDVNCFGGDDGAITITASSTGQAPVLPWDFTWFGTPPPQSSPINTGSASTLPDLAAGLYTIVVSDSDPAGCVTPPVTFTITEPVALAIALEEKSDESCNFGNDGTATISVTGGTPSYSYDWGAGLTPNDSIATGFPAGMYVVTVTDALNCEDTLSVEINIPTPPMITLLENDTLLCYDNTDGQLTVDAIPGGTPILDYQWNVGTGQTITDLSPGIYYVTVTGTDGCFTIDSALVYAPLPLASDSIITVRPACPGFSNGSITAFISGGTSPYTYTWSSDPGNPSNFNLLPGLSADNYQVTVNDANNCEPLVLDIVLDDPPNIEITFSAIDSVTCFEGVPCDGGALSSAIYSDGTTGNFNFQWASSETANGVSSHAATQLCQGYQAVTVTDGFACFNIDSVLIPSPLGLSVDFAQTFSTPVSCYGGDDGSITVEAAGGTGPYSYLWDNAQTTKVITGLTPNDYSVVITDAKGCNFSYSIPVIQPDSLIIYIDLNQTSNVSCSGNSDGLLTVAWQGGSAVGSNPFTWSDNIALSSSPTATDLVPSTYYVTITDGKGCTDSISYSISEPPPIVAVIPTPAQPECFGFQTFITVESVTGGNGPLFTFSVNNAPEQLLDAAIPVFAGEHLVKIYDGAGCFTETTVTVDQPPKVTVDLGPDIEVQLGDSTRLEPSIISVLPLDSIVWSPGTYLSATDVLTPYTRPIESTVYSLTITDVNGCWGSDEFLVDVDKNRNVYIPNVFSPNGDGFNDEFKIFTGAGVAGVSFVRIFDRWGELVFNEDSLSPNPTSSLSPAWDGTLNGKNVSEGVYVYLIEITFEDDVTLLYRGDVTVLY